MNSKFTNCEGCGLKASCELVSFPDDFSLGRMKSLAGRARLAVNSIDIASFPGQFLIACSKQKRTGGVEGLGTRLTSVGCRAVNYGEFNSVRV